MSLLEIVKNMPEAQLEQMQTTIDEQLDQMMGTMIEQAAISEVKE